MTDPQFSDGHGRDGMSNVALIFVVISHLVRDAYLFWFINCIVISWTDAVIKCGYASLLALFVSVCLSLFICLCSVCLSLSLPVYLSACLSVGLMFARFDETCGLSAVCRLFHYIAPFKI